MNNNIRKKYIKLLGLIVLASLSICSRLYAVEPVPEKSLILYYSRTGNTRTYCEVIQKTLNAEIIEIKDLNSRQGGLGIVGGMLKTLLGMHTDIEPEKVDLAPYEVIIIGSPIWASKVTPAIRTFIETNSFNGKKVIMFNTSDLFVEEKYQEKNKAMVQAVGADVIGYFQVNVMKEVAGEKVPRDKAEVLKDAQKAAAEIEKRVSAKVIQ